LGGVALCDAKRAERRAEFGGLYIKGHDEVMI
jgi:hypothetical protein